MEKQYKGIVLGIILLSWLAVLFVGLIAGTPMIGDEVTHYYMLETQAERLPEPCFEANIPLGFNAADREIRCYPHADLWHYVGAIVYRVTGSTAAVQIYHSLFLLQLLLAVYAIVGRVALANLNARLLAIASIASLPATLIFSVAFYQDVPAAAQVMTAFLLLTSGRWLIAAVFLAMALGIKENMMLFVPAYTVALVASVWSLPVWRRFVAVMATVILLLASCWCMSYAIMKYAGGDYYPYQVLKVTVNNMLLKLSSISADSPEDTRGDAGAPQVRVLPATLFAPNVIANHPGDLRIPKNWLIYGGGVLWLLLCLGLAGLLVRRKEEGANKFEIRWNILMLFAGASYLMLAWCFLEAPEARFFMPGILFLSIPAAIYAVRVPGFRLWIWVLITASVLQTGGVLYKTFTLRSLSPGLKEAIEYLQREPPNPNKIFMYPEGNYRLFPCNHDWYLDYELPAFWSADNDKRLEMLSTRGIGAIVVKKYLVGVMGPEMNNHGIYPDYFVRDIDRDARFRKVFDNTDVTIYRLPGSDAAPAVNQP